MADDYPGAGWVEYDLDDVENSSDDDEPKYDAGDLVPYKGGGEDISDSNYIDPIKELEDAYFSSVDAQGIAKSALKAAEKAANLFKSLEASTAEHLASGATASSSSTAPISSSDQAVKKVEFVRRLLEDCERASNRAKYLADRLTKLVQETPVNQADGIAERANEAESFVAASRAEAYRALSQIEAAINQK